jgi:hypothetical protein
MRESSQVIPEEPHPGWLAPGGIGVDRPPVATLPREVVHPMTWRRVAFLVTYVLALVVVANWIANAYLLHYTPNEGYSLIHEKWRLVEETNGLVNWAILGDSSCNQGLDPEIWDALLGGHSLNLCTMGGMLALDDVWMLHRLIERGLTPCAVLVVHVVDIWERNPNPLTMGQLPARATWSEGEPQVRFGPKEMVQEFLSRYVPLVSQNLALRRVVTEPRGWFERRFPLSEQGFLAVARADPGNVTRDVAYYLRAVRSMPFSISKANMAALAELRRISEQHDIEVFLTTSPIFEGLLTDEVFLAYIHQMQNQLSMWSESGERLHYLPEIVTFRKTAMQSADHLVAEAADVYTRRVAALVRQVIHGKGCATLGTLVGHPLGGSDAVAPCHPATPPYRVRQASAPRNAGTPMCVNGLH